MKEEWLKTSFIFLKKNKLVFREYMMIAATKKLNAYEKMQTILKIF